MSKGLEQIRQRMNQYLLQQGVDARQARPDGAQQRLEKPAVVVSLRACRAQPGGFLDYMGERYNEDTGLWEELYGRRVEVTFGLDLWAPKTGGGEPLQELFEQLSGVMAAGAPEGMSLREFSCGETEYDGNARLHRRQAQAVYLVCLYAAAQPGEAFLDFELRGGLKE